MKIARIETSGGDRAWAVVDPGAGTVRRIVGRFSEWAPRTAAAGPPLPLEGQSLNLGDVRLLAPIEPGGRVFGVAANYGAPSGARGRRDRAPHPVTYIRPDSAIVHPDQELRFPAVTRQVDLGLELVAVVARRLGDEPHATACLLGYTIGSGISARAASGDVGAPDLFSEKVFDRTAALGPWITTLDEFGGPGQPQVAIAMRRSTGVRDRPRRRPPQRRRPERAAASGAAGGWPRRAGRQAHPHASTSRRRRSAQTPGGQRQTVNPRS